MANNFFQANNQDQATTARAVTLVTRMVTLVIEHLTHCFSDQIASICCQSDGFGHQNVGIERRSAHALAKHYRNSLDNDVYWMEDSPPPAVEALIQDVLLL